jgi:hypothetical protein
MAARYTIEQRAARRIVRETRRFAIRSWKRITYLPGGNAHDRRKFYRSTAREAEAARYAEA